MHPPERSSNRPRRRPGRKVPLEERHASDPNHAWEYAITLLARRDYSSAELTRKLEERGYLEHPVEVVVGDLVSMNKVNDERYGQNFVAYRARRGHGPARIRAALKTSGLTRSAIDDAVKGEEAPDFAALARSVRARKFGAEIPKDRKERARQARFLQYRGFSTDHIRAVLDGAEEDLAPGSEPDPN